MNLDLTDDQRLLKDMLGRFVLDEGGLEARRAAIASDRGWSSERWGRMAGLGLLALFLGEARGGLGGGGTELMLVGEALGRGLLTEPYLDNAVVAAPLLAAAGSEHVAALADGSRCFALVAGDIAARDGRLSGRARAVPGADSADALLVVADDGALYHVAADAPGVTRSGFPLHGGGRAADLAFDAVAGERLLDAAAAAAPLARAAERRIAFLAAEALGIADLAFATTVDYLKTRVQFGRPIGANQALQHRAAEMFVELEQLRSAAILAACTLDEPDDAERARALAAVVMVAGKAARFIAQQAVQLHGGIGVTEEHAIGHCFLRLTAIGILLSAAEATGASLADLGGFVAPQPYWETS